MVYLHVCNFLFFPQNAPHPKFNQPAFLGQGEKKKRREGKKVKTPQVPREWPPEQDQFITLLTTTPKKKKKGTGKTPLFEVDSRNVVDISRSVLTD